MATYISGPMTGLPQFNYPAFVYAATVLRAQGVDARSPHEIADGCDESCEHPWEWYMRRALRMLLECDEIVLLSGWKESLRACFERTVAELFGMPVREWEGSAS
jgi:hypothetical protein